MCGKHATALNSGRQIFAFGDLERRGVFTLTPALSYSLCYAKASEGRIAAGGEGTDGRRFTIRVANPYR